MFDKRANGEIRFLFAAETSEAFLLKVCFTYLSNLRNFLIACQKEVLQMQEKPSFVIVDLFLKITN